MITHPLISVVIPSHNSEKSIGIALQSIIDQTYPHLEIIIIDDNSTDDTEKVVVPFIKKYPHRQISYYKLPFDDPQRVNKRGRNINAGYMARNYAIDKIKGEWVTFQDADDASLLNRISVQYDLAQEYKAIHICVDWQQYKDEYVGKTLNAEHILATQKNSSIFVTKEEIYALSKKTKGIFIKIFGATLSSYIPFEWKRLRVINKLFFGSLEQYPGTGNSPLFKHEVFKKVQFRKLSKRVWPSFMGRGADRDFNFQVAETFKNSMTFRLPLYLWKSNKQNERYEDYGKFVE